MANNVIVILQENKIFVLVNFIEMKNNMLVGYKKKFGVDKMQISTVKLSILRGRL